MLTPQNSQLFTSQHDVTKRW